MDLSLDAPDIPDNLPCLMERARLVSTNPVAAAEFFHILVTAFIDCLLGFDKRVLDPAERLGVIGPVVAYGGSVETQGRGTLHLHKNVYCANLLHPADMFTRISVNKSDYRRTLFRVLRSCINECLPALHAERLTKPFAPIGGDETDQDEDFAADSGVSDDEDAFESSGLRLRGMSTH